MSKYLPPVNTHIHLPPNFSAFNTVDEALAQASLEGVEILGASNYYDFTVYDSFAKKAAQKGIEPLFGIEIVCRIESLAEQGIKINDPGNPGKMYICGKAIRRFERPTPRASHLLHVIRSGDQARMDVMIELLTKVFQQARIDVALDSETIIGQVSNRFAVSENTVVLQERHVAQAFQEALFETTPLEERLERMTALFQAATLADPTDPVCVQADIRTHLMKTGRPAFVEERYVTFEEAKELVEELGGILCYPIVADGMSPISAFESDPNDLARSLRDLDIGAVEFVPNRNSPRVLSEYVDVLQRNSFTLSAGTEHNTTERIPIVPQCKGGAPVPEAAQKLFVRGAFRQSEHQHEALSPV